MRSHATTDRKGVLQGEAGAVALMCQRFLHSRPHGVASVHTVGHCCPWDDLQWQACTAEPRNASCSGVGRHCATNSLLQACASCSAAQALAKGCLQECIYPLPVLAELQAPRCSTVQACTVPSSGAEQRIST
jgi:hypothetical protein